MRLALWILGVDPRLSSCSYDWVILEFLCLRLEGCILILISIIIITTADLK